MLAGISRLLGRHGFVSRYQLAVQDGIPSWPTSSMALDWNLPNSSACLDFNSAHMRMNRKIVVPLILFGYGLTLLTNVPQLANATRGRFGIYSTDNHIDPFGAATAAE